jgi:hypothetical protein
MDETLIYQSFYLLQEGFYFLFDVKTVNEPPLWQTQRKELKNEERKTGLALDSQLQNPPIST